LISQEVFLYYTVSMFDDCLIMAGGAGTRLWPASSSRLPKQFLPARNGRSFFSLALERALAVGKRIIIIAGKTHITHVMADAAKLKAAEKKRLIVIEEPAAKNTAAAIACAVAFPERGDGNMIVITSDHIIEPLEKFKNDVELAAKTAEENKLVIFGIEPARPETGYGYIETSSIMDGSKSVYNVKTFHEKPDLTAAKKYAAGKRFLWNSGMFVFKIDFMKEQFKSLAPDIYRHFEKLKEPKKEEFLISKGIKILTKWSGLENAYKKSASISFDYAIAEKCGKTAVVRAGFNWIDIGNWEEYIKICGENNSLVFSVSSENCYVDSDIPVALAGVDDLIVVIRSGKNGENATALITKKSQTNTVKDVVNQIKTAGKTGLL